MTKISNFKSPRSGRPVANQFIIKGTSKLINKKEYKGTAFQSYKSLITLKTDCGKVFLDESTWDYSTTTGKYRNEFLNEGINRTREKIESGIYKLVNLN